MRIQGTTTLLALATVMLAGCGGGVAGAGHVPAELVGSWYAGAGGLSAPYDPQTGAWGMPNGDGLVYVFRADGTFTRGFSSYASSGGCTTGFTALSSGGVDVVDGVVVTTPADGHTEYRDSCAPSLNHDQPDQSLTGERLRYTLMPGPALQLANDAGQSALFRRL